MLIFLQFPRYVLTNSARNLFEIHTVHRFNFRLNTMVEKQKIFSLSSNIRKHLLQKDNIYKKT